MWRSGHNFMWVLPIYQTQDSRLEWEAPLNTEHLVGLVLSLIVLVDVMVIPSHPIWYFSCWYSVSSTCLDILSSAWSSLLIFSREMMLIHWFFSTFKLSPFWNLNLKKTWSFLSHYWLFLQSYGLFLIHISYTLFSVVDFLLYVWIEFTYLFAPSLRSLIIFM